MVDLLYPPCPPEFFGDAGQGSEILPVVDAQGAVIGRTTRYICHYSGIRPLHPVVHLEIIDRNARLYLQKRSARKNSFPNYWDIAVGGHISYGETPGEALVREAGEELGLRDFHPSPIGSYVYECGRERELVFAFAAVGNFAPQPDMEEVEDGRWWTVGEIEQNLEKCVFTPNFEFEFKLYCNTLFSLL